MFDDIRGRLSTVPVLAYPNFQQRFIVEMDASISGLGSVLSHCSRRMASHIPFHTQVCHLESGTTGLMKLEMLAVVWAVTHF